MRAILTLLILTVATLSCKVRTQEHTSPVQRYHILPEPLTQQFTEGRFIITSQTKIAADANLTGVAGYLSDILSSATGHKVSFQPNGSGGNNTIRLALDSGIAGEEGYKLSVKPDGIVISGKTEAGIFYGIQSLRQLFPPAADANNGAKPASIEIAGIEVEDAPRFAWRSMMLDLSRHFISVDEIKKLINSMAAHKLNKLHLHLSDNAGWRIEIKEYPKLTTIGAKGNHADPEAPAQFLTEAQGRELAEYAKKHFITIVPEIDMPGHSAAVARAYPEFDGGERTLNVALPEVEKFVDVVVNRVTDIFQTKYFHFGSDEVFKTNWMNIPTARAKMAELGYKEPRELEGWFDRRTAKHILDKNLMPVAWDEASDFEVDPGTIVQWWRCLEPEKLVEAIHRGHSVIISPADHVYFDYPYNRKEFGAHWEGMRNGGNSTELIYNWEPVPASITGQKLSQVLGVEACVWTEFIGNDRRLEYMIFPRLSAFAEIAWAAPENKNWGKFRDKLDVQVKRYEAQDLNYRKLTIPEQDRPALQPEGFSNKKP